MGLSSVVILLSSLILVQINSSYVHVNQDTYDYNDGLEFQFLDFIAKYNKPYAVGSEEYFTRLRAFKSNLKLYAEMNSLQGSPDSAVYGITKFSDMTQDEFKEKYLSNFKLTEDVLPFSSFATNSAQRQATAKEIPRKFDWRTAGIITEPRDQMQCGSCWAFACMETIESMYARKTNHLVPLSIQQMIDCSYNFSPSLQGCNGGNTCSALQWALQTKTVFVPETIYSYANAVQTCKMRPSVNDTKGPSVAHYSCNSFKNFESRMLELIYSVGPLTVGVDASNWNNYQRGVIRFHCGEVPMNHAVQIVGYDLTGPVPHYIVKNSWGSDFGNGGYVYIMYGDNVCSITELVSTVQVK